MAKFLLVHGSCHGAWCWRDVVPRLRQLGHSVVAVDLPSHGANPASISNVTLESYADKVLKHCDGETIVVGHSMAGYPITAAAEKAPAKIKRLVYVCAYVPVSGMSLTEMRKSWPEQPLMPAIVMSPDGLSFTIDPERIRPLFYHDCPAGTLAYAGPRLCPQAILPQATPLTLTDRSAGVPRSYILCTDDRTIPPDFQRSMVRDWPSEDVHEIPTGHSPFFADPVKLVQLLNKIASE